MTIVEFLQARYDDEQMCALEATPGPWVPLRQHPERAVYCVQAPGALKGVPVMAVDSRLDAEHIALHDPARVLREVEAKRRILDLHPHRRFASLPEEWPEHWRTEIKQALPGTAEPYVGCERDAFNHDYEVFEPAWWCETVLLLALPYADHPDYDPSWSPT